ncbi:uncharacterized protein LOC128235338 [Mya arenaria]|uniref:uncharacterized protein LOC128235338 n=1 Tax=Mya arenaria TaxID=6604 RepID=UPI0022E5550D|nr:uncharacterized protein LOC128235338 [Mya arenaria]
MENKVHLAICIWIILTSGVIRIEARSISNRNSANGLEPANYVVLWINTKMSTKYLSTQRDWIISFIDDIADGSLVDIFFFNVLTTQLVLSFTKQAGIDTYSDALLELNLETINASKFVSSAAIKRTIDNQWYSKVYDNGLPSIAIFLVSSEALLQGELDKILVKTFVITTKDEKLIDDIWTSHATDMDHFLYMDNKEELYQLLTIDTQMRCKTDQYYNDNMCKSCSDLNCKRTEDGRILCETNSDATRDCMYWRPDVGSEEDTSKPTTESYSTGDISTLGTTVGVEAITKIYTRNAHLAFLVWISIGACVVAIFAFLGTKIYNRLLQSRTIPPVAYVARSLLSSIGTIGSKNSAINQPTPGTRIRPQPSAPPEDQLSIDRRSITSSPVTRPYSSPSESSDGGNDCSFPRRPGSGVAHTDKEARENSDQENADNKDPNCENGTSEDEPLLEGHRLNDMSVDGDSSIDDLKPKREKDVWTDKPFRDIHNSLCVQKKGEETETGVHGQNTEGSSDETDVKRLDMQKGVNEQSTEEPSDETDVKRLDMQQGVNEQNTEKSSVETVVECSVKLSVEATS